MRIFTGVHRGGGDDGFINDVLRKGAIMSSRISGVFTIGPLWLCPPLNCEKISHMAKMQPLEKLPQLKIKILATRCQILRLKCSKFDFGWGSARDPAGELTALPQTSYLDLRGPTSKGRGKEGRGGDGRKGEGRENGRVLPPFLKS